MVLNGREWVTKNAELLWIIVTLLICAAKHSKTWQEAKFIRQFKNHIIHIPYKTLILQAVPVAAFFLAKHDQFAEQFHPSVVPAPGNTSHIIKSMAFHSTNCTKHTSKYDLSSQTTHNVPFLGNQLHWQQDTVTQRHAKWNTIQYNTHTHTPV